MHWGIHILFFRYAVSVRWEREQAERRQPPTDSTNSSGPVRERQPLLTFTIEDFNRYFCCCARRVGSMFFLLEKKDGSPIVVAGPCWPFCAFVTLPLIAVLSGLCGYFIVSNPNTGLVSCAMQWRFLAALLSIIVFISHVHDDHGLTAVVVWLDILPYCSICADDVILHEL